MSFLALLGLALGLALDAFAVALAVGSQLPRLTFRHYFRLSFHFGLFQALMPVVGWMAGAKISTYVAAWDHWAVLGLLVFVGGRMLLSSGRDGGRAARDPTRGPLLVILSVATSVDALAIGFSLALLGTRILYPAAIIGVVACVMTVAGMTVGRRFGNVLQGVAEKLGGLILIGIGVKIVIQHVWFS